jgi:hypothetical protein
LDEVRLEVRVIEVLHGGYLLAWRYRDGAACSTLDDVRISDGQRVMSNVIRSVMQ